MRTLEVLRTLGADRVVACVVTLSGREGELASAYRQAGVEIYPLAIHHVTFPHAFMQFLRHWRAEVVHSHVAFSSGPILALARLAGVSRRIAHLRSDGVPVSSLPWQKQIRARLSRRLMWHAATKVLSVSPSALSNASINSKQMSKAEILPNGLDLTRFNPNIVRDVRSAIAPGIREPLIVHVGRADVPTKNRQGALDYFVAYRRNGGKGHLIFVGRDCASGGDQTGARREWQARAHAMGVGQQVAFLGERSDIPEIMASADLFLFTSTLEGLPGVVLEARAVGTPTVSSSVPGAAFLAAELGQIDIVHDENPESWAAAMSNALMEPPTATDRRRAHADLAGSSFDVARTAGRLERLWRGEN
ncbi:glycosyltransferase [Propionibacteriaceae bacterium Y1700]|uniref:glycosyltransferase n=1 Tax=Microlunatus sp. Y1700 TaxID=3418487 RepID=UPI003B7D29D1